MLLVLARDGRYRSGSPSLVALGSPGASFCFRWAATESAHCLHTGASVTSPRHTTRGGSLTWNDPARGRESSGAARGDLRPQPLQHEHRLPADRALSRVHFHIHSHAHTCGHPASRHELLMIFRLTLTFEVVFKCTIGLGSCSLTDVETQQPQTNKTCMYSKIRVVTEA